MVVLEIWYLGLGDFFYKKKKIFVLGLVQNRFEV